jgi:hypothetical protein
MSVVRLLWMWSASLLLVGCQVLTGLSHLEVTSDDGGIDDSGSAPRESEPDASDATPDSAVPPTPPREPTEPTEPDDPESSECPLARGAECDLVRQCGCPDGQRCQVAEGAGGPTCTEPGSLAPGSACQSAAACPAGQTCDDGVCGAPKDPCPSVEDGTCDEAKGTGRCAEGSDAKGCGCQPSLPDATCDLVTQCGCAKGRTCMPEAGGAICTEPRTSSTEIGDRCTTNEDCRAGLACNYGTCQPFCATDRECPDGHACRDV